MYVKIKVCQYVRIFTNNKVNNARWNLNQVKCLLTTISLSQREEKKPTKLSNGALYHNKDFFCKITEESSQSSTYILFRALTNTKILNSV